MKTLTGLFVLALLSFSILTGCEKEEPAVPEHPDTPEAATAADQVPKDHPAH